MELSIAQYISLFIAGIVYGFSKTGTTGAAILMVPIMLHYFTPGQSLGIALPLLIFADVCALVMLRRSVNWKIVRRCMPWAFVGVITGWRVLAYAQSLPQEVGDTLLRRIIAGVMLFVVAAGLIMRAARARKPQTPVDSSLAPKLSPGRRMFASFLAVFGGCITMLANNGAPAYVLYLMMYRLDKFYFMGTAAWIFFFLNASKLPFSIQLGYVNADTLAVNALIVPCIVFGLFFGKWAITRMSQVLFDNMVQVLSLIGAVYLVVRSFS